MSEMMQKRPRGMRAVHTLQLGTRWGVKGQHLVRRGRPFWSYEMGADDARAAHAREPEKIVRPRTDGVSAEC